MVLEAVLLYLPIQPKEKSMSSKTLKNSILPCSVQETQSSPFASTMAVPNLRPNGTKWNPSTLKFTFTRWIRSRLKILETNMQTKIQSLTSSSTKMVPSMTKLNTLRIGSRKKKKYEVIFRSTMAMGRHSTTQAQVKSINSRTSMSLMAQWPVQLERPSQSATTMDALQLKQHGM